VTRIDPIPPSHDLIQIHLEKIPGDSDSIAI